MIEPARADTPVSRFPPAQRRMLLLEPGVVETELAPDKAVYLGPSRSMLRYLMDGGTRVNVAALARSDTWTG